MCPDSYDSYGSYLHEISFEPKSEYSNFTWRVPSHGKLQLQERFAAVIVITPNYGLCVRLSGLGYGSQPEYKWKNEHKEVNNWSFEMF